MFAPDYTATVAATKMWTNSPWAFYVLLDFYDYTTSFAEYIFGRLFWRQKFEYPMLWITKIETETETKPEIDSKPWRHDFRSIWHLVFSPIIGI